MKKERVFHLEDLNISIPVYQDKLSGKDMYDYPDCATEILLTGLGHPCVNAWQEACQYVKASEGITVSSMDCGCCIYYQTESENDLIGICMCEANQIFKKK